jgi:hypothetical protein
MSPPLVADQTGMAMPIIEAEDQLATTVPAIEPAQEPVLRTTKRKRRE